jgi:hypothetical protein
MNIKEKYSIYKKEFMKKVSEIKNAQQNPINNLNVKIHVYFEEIFKNSVANELINGLIEVLK